MPRRAAATRAALEAQTLAAQLPRLNLNAAGIDIGATSHFVAVPEGRDTVSVREFATFTADLHRLADWLEQCGVDTIVMESTGVFWIPVFELLEQRGFSVLLVDARHVKNVSGRKSDVLDCQWLQQLHTYGLLSGAFRPDDQIVVLRSYLRQRAMLVQYAAAHIQHMQKALQQMNLLLHQVVSDITGSTGMTIIRAILAGERDPEVLAQHRDPRCKNSAEVIAKSLVGNYRAEHLFALQQAVTLYEVYQAEIAACDRQIDQYLATFTPVCTDPPPTPPKPRQRRGNPFQFDAHTQLYRMTGVDLTRIDGIDSVTALTLISEIGLDMRRWKTVKHFTSWLRLCPGTKVSGGKVLSSKTKPSANRAAAALRIAAASLYRSQSALGAYLRRMTAKLGKPEAITATAHKLARLVYSMLRDGTDYVDVGQDYYEQRYRERVVRNLTRRAKELGFTLVPEVSETAVT
ncbi:MAG: IS110 family transposase [Chloroflexota bacterium]|nr:IS110 family transposase [Chloroflexota bacterium]